MSLYLYISNIHKILRWEKRREIDKEIARLILKFLTRILNLFERLNMNVMGVVFVKSNVYYQQPAHISKQYITPIYIIVVHLWSI